MQRRLSQKLYALVRMVPLSCLPFGTPGSLHAAKVTRDQVEYLRKNRFRSKERKTYRPQGFDTCLMPAVVAVEIPKNRSGINQSRGHIVLPEIAAYA